jgi:hypothetical protein
MQNFLSLPISLCTVWAGGWYEYSLYHHVHFEHYKCLESDRRHLLTRLARYCRSLINGATVEKRQEDLANIPRVYRGNADRVVAAETA